MISYSHISYCCIDLVLTNSLLSFFNTETYFTGLLDCHKLVLFIFKATFSKKGPKELMYSDLKNFDQEIFTLEFRTSVSSETVHDYASFEDSFLGVFNKNAPLKKKVLRANHTPFVTKIIRKAMMKRSYLEKLYFNKKTTESLKQYKKYKNFCSRFKRRNAKNLLIH